MVNAIRTRRSATSANLASAISGHTATAAVFGDPVEHSLSPAMHNAAYAALGLDRIYLAHRVKAEDLADAIRAISALGIIGVNLTVPHKEAAARFLKDLSDEARLLRAVNCIINRGGALSGDNTDARGLERDLRALGVNLRRRFAIVTGAGGAAAAAVLACSRMGAARIVIANRTRARASALARRFAGFAALTARGLDALTDRALLADAAIVINATSMGLATKRFADLDYKATPRDCFFYDCIYAPKPTAFLDPARGLGRPHADGAGMLANQGELAFKLFNRIAPPSGIMWRALIERLGRAQ